MVLTSALSISQTDRIAQFVEAEPAIHHEFIITDLVKFLLVGVEFVLNIADYFFKHVFECDHAHGAAKLVDYDGKVRMLPQKKVEQLLERHHFRDRCQVALNPHQVGVWITHHRDQLLDVNKADCVIEMPATKRKAGVSRLQSFLYVVFESILQIEVNDFPARSHDIADDATAKIERVNEKVPA